ncbi:MAG: iscR [Candidatus Midichloriaceae bacterium]|jgi:Rrf2 family iron-sulfur cluster assembly transcriptional regulator|nr:iscR [Candidatus Midichloriaceae bacterium]
MILTTKGRFAVMALVDIAFSSGGVPVPLVDIAKRQNIDPGYLEQIFIKLKKSGLVASFRGPGGGYVLGVEGDNIMVLDILKAVGEDVKMTRCEGKKEDLSGGCMHDKSTCSTHKLWRALEFHIENYLGNITLNDVCKGDKLIKENA